MIFISEHILKVKIKLFKATDVTMIRRHFGFAAGTA